MTVPFNFGGPPMTRPQFVTVTRFGLVTLSACALLVAGGVGCGSNSSTMSGNGGTTGSAGRGGTTGSAGRGGTTGTGTGTAGAAGTDATGNAGAGGGAGAGGTTPTGGTGGGGTAGRGNGGGNAGGATGTAGGGAGRGGSGAGNAGRGGSAGGSAGTGGGTAGAGGRVGTGGRGGAGGMMCEAMAACTPGDTCEGPCNARGLHVVCACPTSGQLLCASTQCPTDGGTTPDGGTPTCPQGTSSGDDCDPQDDEVCNTMCSNNDMYRTCLCMPSGGGGNGQWACTALMSCQ
jgi:hypothetical protein